MGRGSCPLFSIGENNLEASSESSSKDSIQCISNRKKEEPQSHIPLPIIHNLIRLAQYSLLHHSTSLLLVSLPIAPPSASVSLSLLATDNAGDAILDGIGDGATLGVLDTTLLSANLPCACSVLAACDRLSLLPLPNFRQTCPSLLRCLFSWNILHISDW
jgi:hypothetical protein